MPRRQLLLARLVTEEIYLVVSSVSVSERLIMLFRVSGRMVTEPQNKRVTTFA
jgi:hypothetical protein